MRAKALISTAPPWRTGWAAQRRCCVRWWRRSGSMSVPGRCCTPTTPRCRFWRPGWAGPGPEGCGRRCAMSGPGPEPLRRQRFTATPPIAKASMPKRYLASAAVSSMPTVTVDSKAFTCLIQRPDFRVVLRLLILKHIRNWSYQVLEREVRANLVYRNFSRVGGAKMPDAKTIGRWGVALGPQVIKQIHERMVKIAQDKGVADGRRMRVDTTVVETNIHYPTDSSLLGDGVRVLTRTMKKITKIAGKVGAKLRDRSRSVKLRVLDIARAARSKAKQSQEKLKRAYGQLLNSTSRVVGQAKRFSTEVAMRGTHQRRQAATRAQPLPLQG